MAARGPSTAASTLRRSASTSVADIVRHTARMRCTPSFATASPAAWHTAGCSSANARARDWMEDAPRRASPTHAALRTPGLRSRCKASTSSSSPAGLQEASTQAAASAAVVASSWGSSGSSGSARRVVCQRKSGRHEFVSTYAQQMHHDGQHRSLTQHWHLTIDAVV